MAPRRARRKPCGLRSRWRGGYEAAATPEGSPCVTHGLRPRGVHGFRQWAECLLAAGRRRGFIMGVEFLIWIARNPLKRLESDEGIQENPNPLSWSGLVWLGFGLEKFGLSRSDLGSPSGAGSGRLGRRQRRL